jgi:hypothetical protein
MFNDAMYFLEQAKKLSDAPENNWLRWRYLRGSILYSFTSIESYVNSFIIGNIINSLNLPEVAKDFENWRLNIEIKFNIIIPILIGKRIDKSSQEWRDFQTLKNIRNRITHYSGGTQIYNDNDPYGVNLKNAEMGINMVRGMVKQLKTLVGEESPPWVDQKQSITIR